MDEQLAINILIAILTFIVGGFGFFLIYSYINKPKNNGLNNPFKQQSYEIPLKSPEVTNSMKSIDENAVTLDLGKGNRIIVIGKNVSRTKGLASLFQGETPKLSTKAEKELEEVKPSLESRPKVRDLEKKVIESLIGDEKKPIADMSVKDDDKYKRDSLGRKMQMRRECTVCGEFRQTRFYPEDMPEYICHLCKKKMGKK